MGNTYTAQIPVVEGGNTVTAVATLSTGEVHSTSVNITRDTQKPRIAIDSPVAGFVVGTNTVTVTGIINDTVIGTVNSQQATVFVNGVPASVVNRTFLAPNVPLVSGINTLQATATDRAGNTATASIQITFQDAPAAGVRAVGGVDQTATIGSLLPVPLRVLVTDDAGTPLENKAVIFKVVQNDGALLSATRTARSVIVRTDASGHAEVSFRLGTRVGVGNHQVQAMVVGFPIEVLFRASATPAPPALIVAGCWQSSVRCPGAALAPAIRGHRSGRGTKSSRRIASHLHSH